MKKKTYGIFYSAVSVLAFMLMVMIMPFRVQGATVTDSYPNAKIYNVTDYGADNTGKKKSDSAVTAAIKAAKQDTAEEKVIYFPSGKYSLSSVVRLYGGMTLAAESNAEITGTGEKVINGHDAAGICIDGGVWKGGANTSVFSFNRVSGFTVKNVKITTGSVGMWISKTTAEIDNAYVTGCKSIGITSTNSSSVTVKNSQILKNGAGYPKNGLGQGMGVYKSASLTAINCKVNNNYECGVSLRVGNLTMKNCTLYSNGRHGVGTDDKCTVVMTGCDIYKNGYREKMNGVIVVDGSKGTFTNCKFRSNAVTGLLISNGGTKVTVKGCTFTGNKAHNIYADNTESTKSSVTISNSSFSKCSGGSSIGISVNKKSAFSIKLKSGNKFNNVPKYVYQIGNQWYTTK